MPSSRGGWITKVGKAEELKVGVPCVWKPVVSEVPMKVKDTPIYLGV